MSNIKSKASHRLLAVFLSFVMVFSMIPFSKFDIMFGKGISKEGDVLDLAVNLNIIVKAGAWFSYNDAKIGQGRENAKIYLSQHPDIMAEVENKVRAHYNLPLKDAEPTALAESGDDAE